jgi:hypothetical protein
MSSIAIMQPYLFPYIGYFQLVDSVDAFVFYDDVNFIKKGWIHRNRILIQQEAHFVSLSCKKISQNKLICETELVDDDFHKRKWMQTCEFAYKKAPFFKQTMDLLESCFSQEFASIGHLAAISVQLVSKYLGLLPKFYLSSENPIGLNEGRAERLIAICEHYQASQLINPVGGGFLYDPNLFYQKGIELTLLKFKLNSYQQLHSSHSFVSGLSILDVLMFNSIDEIRTKILPGYQLTQEITHYAH